MTDRSRKEPNRAADQSTVDDVRSGGVRGGIVLSSREAVGMFIRLAGVVALTNIVGPAGYGVYAGSVAIVFVLTSIAQMSAELYLVRAGDDHDRTLGDAVLGYLLAASALVVAIGLVATEFLRRTTDVPVVTLQVLLLSIPASVAWAPAQAMLERRFEFGRLAILELTGDIVLYGAALPLAVVAGARGAAIGYAAWQLYLLIGACALARYRPRPRWSNEVARDLVRFGSALTAAQCLRRSRELLNPLIVGPFAGPAAVGVVALGIRLIETVMSVVRAAARVVYAGLARLGDDRPRLGRATSTAMSAQVGAVGLGLAATTLLAPDVIPIVFGDDWSATLELLPWLALAALVTPIPTTAGHLLTVLGRTRMVGWMQAAQVALTALIAVVAVDALGSVGFGVATLVGLIPLAVLVRAAIAEVPLTWTTTVTWVVGIAPALFAPLVESEWRFVLVLGPVAAVLSPPGRHQLTEMYEALRHRGAEAAILAPGVTDDMPSTTERRSPDGARDNERVTAPDPGGTP